MRGAAPTATYRIQLRPEFGFADVAAIAGYLADLGVSHVYLSPILQAVPGSTHGYDVLDHNRVSEDLGGREAFEAMVVELHARGLRVVVDVVPNHMARAVPEHLNPQWWDVLRVGPDSPYAGWFDIDRTSADGRIVLPILGTELANALQDNQIEKVTEGGEVVLAYGDHRLPVRPGTQHLPLPELLTAQHYELCFWRDGLERLNYRRFFDVDTLLGVRVEDPDVFDATHELTLALVRDGFVDGLRIDHPDGLADPRGYLRRLAVGSGGVWTVVEKILEGDETLPSDWLCAGTTGYDALRRIGGVFVRPDAAEPLRELMIEETGETRDLTAVIAQAKALVAVRTLRPEIDRLVRLLRRIAASLPDDFAGGLAATARTTTDERTIRLALTAVLVEMDCYRVYAVADEEPTRDTVDHLDRIIDAACATLATAGTLAADDPVGSPAKPPPALAWVRVIGALALATTPIPGVADAERCEFVVRFQQTCGPVMAKGIEDTAFYRWPRLAALNEVGGDPDHVGVTPAELDSFARALLARWPTTMTALSTHDTKRSEDVRARLAVLSHRPTEWAAWLGDAWWLAARHRQPQVDPVTEYLLWQNIIGAWPISDERARASALKSVREAKRRTTWTEPDPAYEQAIERLVEALVTDPELVARFDAWVADTDHITRAIVLGQKLLQLVHPGVPDLFQGSELVDLSLVDPDNRRAVDFDYRAERLAALDAGEAPRDISDEKLLLVSRALRLRRAHPQWFTAAGASWRLLDVPSDGLLAVARGADRPEVVAVLTTRFGSTADASAGDLGYSLSLPPGQWRDELTGAEYEELAGVERLLARYPVALLVRAG